VLFYPVEARCNPSIPSHDKVLDSQNEVPVAFCVTADSLSHDNHTDHIFMVPARNNAPRTSSPATSPPSSDQYEVISDWIPSSGPPPRRSIVSYFVATTHLWCPTPNITDPSVVMIRSTGSSKLNGSDAGMSPAIL
jgi:hypothetical protein